jgi:hypothetical protein
MRGGSLMPQGYYTIEQWTRGKKGSAGAWVEVLHLLFGRSLTDAETAVKNLGTPGLYRVVQMQRVVWAEQEGDELRMRKSHAGSPENLDEVRQMFERSKGRYPVEEVKEARRRQKRRSK